MSSAHSCGMPRFTDTLFKLTGILALLTAPLIGTAGEEENKANGQTDISAEPRQVVTPQEGKELEVKAPVALSPKKAAVWSLVGVSGATLITGGIFGFTALDENERYEDNPADDFKDRRDSRALASYISFGVAGACAITALIVWLAMDDESETSTTAAAVSSDGASIIIRF